MIARWLLKIFWQGHGEGGQTEKGV